MVSCRTGTPAVDYAALAKASITLGIDVDLTDNHKLYTESAKWIGTPYRSGGNSRKGVDCSGLSTQLYQKVYRVKLPRSSQEQYKKSKKVKRAALKEGDLLFFTGKGSGKQVSHVGIYLKNGQFIHASTTLGVIISSLNEAYYRKYWKSGGRY